MAPVEVRVNVPVPAFTKPFRKIPLPSSVTAVVPVTVPMMSSAPLFAVSVTCGAVTGWFTVIAGAVMFAVVLAVTPDSPTESGALSMRLKLLMLAPGPMLTFVTAFEELLRSTLPLGDTIRTAAGD